MLMPIFYFHQSRLELSLPWWRQIQLTSKPWPLSKIVARNHSVCLAVHLYKLFPTNRRPAPGWRCSTGVFYPIVPAKFKKDIFLHLHNISGRLTSWHLVSSRFVWYRLSNDIDTWARSCLLCQQGKIKRYTHLLTQPIPIPQQGFAHLHIY